jgi:hypothetical protein
MSRVVITPARRTAIMLCGAVLVSFCTTLVVLNPQWLDRVPSEAKRIAGTGIADRTEPRPFESGSAAPASRDSRAVVPGGRASAGAVNSAVPLATREELESFALARDAATTATETEDRIRAIQSLGNAPAEIGVDVLQRVLHEAEDFRERTTAIIALRQQASRGDPGARIETALRDAGADTNPTVAAAARSAYEALRRSR